MEKAEAEDDADYANEKRVSRVPSGFKDWNEAVSVLSLATSQKKRQRLQTNENIISALQREKLKQKISDDEWGSGFIAVDDEQE